MMGQNKKDGLHKPDANASRWSFRESEIIPVTEERKSDHSSSFGIFLRSHEELLVNRLSSRFDVVKKNAEQTREAAKRTLRRVAFNELAKDWLSSNIDLEVRNWMVDKVLPTLVLGTEKLLVQVDKHNLAGTDKLDYNFNPLNYLAQYLMRNNPKYCNFAEASPYMRGLRCVSEELKLQLLTHPDNQLLKFKLSTQAKRQEREILEEANATEAKRRLTVIHDQFVEWNNGKAFDLLPVQNALLSFVETISNLGLETSEEMQLGKGLDQVDDTGRDVNQEEYVEYLQPFLMPMSQAGFEVAFSHLAGCAKIFHKSIESMRLKRPLSLYFRSFDIERTGFLEQQPILKLLTTFYLRLPPETQDLLQDPRHWPIRDVTEVYQEEEEEEEKVEKEEDEEEMEEEVNEKDEAKAKEKGKEKAKEKDSEDLGKAETNGAADSAEDKANERKKSQANDDAKLKSGSPIVKPVSAGRQMIDRGLKSTQLTLGAVAGPPAVSSPSQLELGTYNREKMNLNQFIQLMLTFFRLSINPTIMQQLVSYIKAGYVVEKSERTSIQENEADILDKKKKLNALFESWDNEGSGFLNCDEVAWILSTYKDLKQYHVVEKALKAFREKSTYLDGRLTKQEFRELILLVESNLQRGDTFDAFIDFLTGSIALSKAEQARGDIRSSCIRNIVHAAEASCIDVEPVYAAVFRAMAEDAELHGMGKKVSVSISLLEKNRTNPAKGNYQLRYVAATLDHPKNMIGHTQHRDTKGISFAAVESGHPIHIPRLKEHANLQFSHHFKKSEDLDGSILAIPIKDKKKRIFGMLLVDTIEERKKVQPSKVVKDSARGDSPTQELGRRQSRGAAHDDRATPEPGKLTLRKMSKSSMHGESPLLEHGRTQSRATVPEDRATPDSGKLTLRKMSKASLPGDSSAQEQGQRTSVRKLKDPEQLHSQLGENWKFANHEISFYEGVAKAFSIAYHQLNVQQNMMHASEHALSWIIFHCPSIVDSSLYLVKTHNTDETKELVLRKMMSTNASGNVTTFLSDPPRIDRKHHFFKEYLFRCANNAVLMTTTAHGNLHLATPLRNAEGLAIFVYDVNIGKLASLPTSETIDLMLTLQVLQAALNEILAESEEGIEVAVLTGDQRDNDTRIALLFGRLMLLELRESIARLDDKSYALLKKKVEFTSVIHPIIKCVLGFLHPDLTVAGEFDDWEACIPYIDQALAAQLVAYDPTEPAENDAAIDLVKTWIHEIDYGSVKEVKSLLLKHLYNWVCACLMLIGGPIE